LTKLEEWKLRSLPLQESMTTDPVESDVGHICLDDNPTPAMGQSCRLWSGSRLEDSARGPLGRNVYIMFTICKIPKKAKGMQETVKTVPKHTAITDRRATDPWQESGSAHADAAGCPPELRLRAQLREGAAEVRAGAHRRRRALPAVLQTNEWGRWSLRARP